MKKWPARCYVRAYVLNSLQHGPAEYEGLATYAERNLGYDRRQLREAAANLGVFVTEINGKPHWQRPSNVVALWWSKKAQPNGRFPLRRPRRTASCSLSFIGTTGGGRKRFLVEVSRTAPGSQCVGFTFF
jgi:hypothetical protein